jgi:hypothetical protein
MSIQNPLFNTSLPFPKQTGINPSSQATIPNPTLFNPTAQVPSSNVWTWPPNSYQMPFPQSNQSAQSVNVPSNLPSMPINPPQSVSPNWQGTFLTSQQPANLSGTNTAPVFQQTTNPNWSFVPQAPHQTQIPTTSSSQIQQSSYGTTVAPNMTTNWPPMMTSSFMGPPSSTPPVTTTYQSFPNQYPPTYTERCYKNFVCFDGSNWDLFMPLFLQEGANFGWSHAEYKHQFLRRLRGNAMQIGRHIGNLHEMPWITLFDLAAKWYGKVHNKFHYQVQFKNQKREADWTYSQFSSLLRALATKGFPERTEKSIDEMVLDRLVDYSREIDHLIYERYTQNVITSAQAFADMADMWFASFPDREPSYEKFWKGSTKRTNLFAITNPDSIALKTPPRNSTNFSSRVFQNRSQRNNRRFAKVPKNPCPFCKTGPPNSGYHWGDQCPNRGNSGRLNPKQKDITNDSLNWILPPLGNNQSTGGGKN